MAFTVTVTDRHDLDVEPSHGCDTCSTNSVGVPAAQVAQGPVDNAITAQLSPLED